MERGMYDYETSNIVNTDKNRCETFETSDIELSKVTTEDNMERQGFKLRCSQECLGGKNNVGKLN